MKKFKSIFILTILILLATIINIGLHILGSSPATGDDANIRGQIASEIQAVAKKTRLKQDEKNGFLILVNKEHSLSPDYMPDDLEEIEYFAPDRSPESRFMRGEAAKHFNLMVEKAKEEGLEIVMTTAYRSYVFQEILYNGYVAQKGEAAANMTSAKPGQSEHQTGLAVDLSSPVINNAISYEFGEIAEGRWIADNSHKYGFIIRYPKSKEEITGYSYEPWHIRYVGRTAAGDIHEEGLTLEEYIAMREEDKTLTGEVN